MQLHRPDLHAEAQRGIAALQRADFSAARDAFRQVTSSAHASAQAWLFYAQACEGCCDWGNSLRAIDHVLSTDAANPFALLMKGDIFALNGNERAAVSFYRRAIRRCSQLDELPGDLEVRLQRARDAVARSEERFIAKLKEHLAATGIADVPPRCAEALAIASDKQRVYLQEPTSFYFPGLPQQPWYSRDQFSWVGAMEAAVPAMRAEIEQVLGEDAGLEPYVQEQADRASRGHSLLNDARWSAFHLWKDGKVIDENARRCPTVMRMLERAAMPQICGRSPMALISILKPGTHIPPHTGMLNTRLICHVPLVVPAGCKLRVGGESREVIEGKTMIFDDSIEHEAWNNGQSNRAVLLFEIWRPEIDDEEKVALTAMFEAVSGYEASADG